MLQIIVSANSLHKFVILLAADLLTTCLWQVYSDRINLCAALSRNDDLAQAGKMQCFICANYIKFVFTRQSVLDNTFPDFYSVPFDFNQQHVCCAALPNNSPCTTSADCVSNACRKGKCTGKPEGAVCTENGVCATEVCTAIGSQRQCTKRVPGAACKQNAACASNSCINSVCQCSSACTFSFTCAQGCTLGAICNEGICGTLKTSGATCSSPSECASNSCYAGVCQCSASCVYNPASCPGGCSSPNTCIVLPGLLADFCGVKKPNGGTCRGPNECVSGTCSQGICTLKPAGALCTTSNECASGSCFSGVCECAFCLYNPASCAGGCALPNTCFDNRPSTPNYCGVKKADGGTCFVQDECVSGLCNQGFCTLKTPGATCTNDSECASNSCFEGICECTTFCTYNSTSCPQGCSLPTECIAVPGQYVAYCGIKEKNGGACYDDALCASDFCNEGFCTLKASGLSCAQDSDCASSNCLESDGFCE